MIRSSCASWHRVERAAEKLRAFLDRGFGGRRLRPVLLPRARAHPIPVPARDQADAAGQVRQRRGARDVLRPRTALRSADDPCREALRHERRRDLRHAPGLVHGRRRAPRLARSSTRSARRHEAASREARNSRGTRQRSARRASPRSRVETVTDADPRPESGARLNPVPMPGRC